MSQDHYLPLFVGDFLASTATWTGPERGLYVQLLMTAWTGGPLPCDLDRLALVLHYEPKEFKRLWPVMAHKFQNGDGRLTNLRLEAVRAKNAEVHAARSAKGIAAANARWNAPSITQASVEQCEIDAPPMPSDPIRSESDPNRSKPEIGARAKRARSGHRLPEDWILTPERQEFARGLGLDPVAEFHQFCDYWRGVPGARGLKADWDATWRNSCRRSVDLPAARQTSAKREDVSEMVARLRREADAAGEPAL